jgi:hypothetical protein
MKVALLPLVMAGAWFAFSVKLCTAFEPTAFAAVMVTPKVPLTVGVPPSVAVPFPLSWNKIPFGSDPLSEIADVGNPVVVTENEPAVPTMKVALLPLVMAGAWFAFSVKLCTAFEPTPFAAVMVTPKAPLTVGVPLSVAVPFPLSRNETPLGNDPFSEIAAVGNPVVVTANEPAVPTRKVALLLLVIAGA